MTTIVSGYDANGDWFKFELTGDPLLDEAAETAMMDAEYCLVQRDYVETENGARWWTSEDGTRCGCYCPYIPEGLTAETVKETIMNFKTRTTLPND